MSRNVAVLLLAITLASSCMAHTGGLERSARLVHGNVKTTHSLSSSMRGRKLSGDADDSLNERVWLIGFPSDLQHHLHLSMKTMACQVLHPLPGSDDHHWIITASQGLVTQLLDKHPELTAAPLPSELKLSPELRNALAADSMQKGGRINLDVLMPHATQEQAQQAMAAARKHLAQPGTTCNLGMQAGMHGFIVSVCAQDLAATASWLVMHPRVTWVEIHHEAQLHNLHASAAIQSGDTSLQVPDTSDYEDDIRQGASGDLFPLWSAGLDGTGQVVGVVDNGLDTDSCFFFDQSIPNPSTSPGNRILNMSKYLTSEYPGDKSSLVPLPYDPVAVFQDTQHRKVVQMVYFANKSPDSHGTHVAGSVAGAAYNMDSLNKPLLATGAAPGAKIAFYDIGYTDQNNQSRLMYPPFPDMIYDIQHECYRYDLYTWFKRDMLLVFGAGNEGEQLENYQTGTIGSPANAKNVLAVGAAENWVQVDAYNATMNQKLALKLAGPDPYTVPATGWNALDRMSANKFYWQLLLETPATDQSPAVEQTITLNPEIGQDVYPMMNAPNDSFPGKAPPPGTQAALGSSFLSLAHDTKYIVVPVQADSCQPLPADTQPGSKIFLIAKTIGDCAIQQSVMNAYKANAAGVIIYYPAVTGVVMGATPTFYNLVKSFPATTVSASLANVIVSWLSAPKTPGSAANSVSIRIDNPAASATIPIENIAKFSSTGSNVSDTQTPIYGETNVFATDDVRIKPDVIAPGYVLSAWTDGVISGVMDQCEARYDYGTSMATPIAAGAAAIVRQYFEGGYYPTGDPKTGVPLSPSAALVKAVLISGASEMEGIHRTTGYNLDPTPSPVQGWGRIDLSYSLPLPNNEIGWSIQVRDAVNMTSSRDSHTYALAVRASNPSKELTITLVWNDYPAFPGNAYNLVNDLDLMVTEPDGTVDWGNDKENGDKQNNVEQVYFEAPDTGKYTITVRATYIYADGGPQPYSLVVLGGFDTLTP